MMAPLRCAVLSLAHVHAATYAGILRRSSAATLGAVWDDDAARRREAARYGAPVTDDLDAVLRRGDVQAVIITAENVRHRALCEAACAAGKHVLCEKPLATTTEDAEAMIAAARRAGVLLATAFPLRHNAPARRVKDHMRAGTIGAALAVRATNHGKLPPGWFTERALSGGGAVLDHTVHVVDLLRWYLEDEPVEVYAEISHGLYGLEVEDAAFMTILFRSGVVATLDPSWAHPASYPIWSDVMMEIAGELGVLRLDAFAENVTRYPRDGTPAGWLPWGQDGDEAMLEGFVRAVREDGGPAADGRDGERALAVALAAYDSARAGQPVAVPPPAGA